PGDEAAGAAEPAEDVVADDGELLRGRRARRAGAGELSLGGVSDVGARACDAGRGRHALVGIGGQARGLVERPAAALLHETQVGGGVLDEPHAIEDDAAVDAVHVEHDSEQHADAGDGGGELAELAADVLQREVHGAAPDPDVRSTAMRTMASVSMAKRSGGVSKATLTSSSRVAGSDWREMRATRPAYVSPLLRRIVAGRPGSTWATSASSIRPETQRVAGSTSR